MKKKIFTLLLALGAIATTAQAQNTINGHEYVDLRLPSGTLWATCNVGAEKPEDYGDYFAWGETETKDDYSWDTYKFGKSDALTKYTGSDKSVLDPDEDAATANWGEGWRMPTFDEIKELLDNTTNEWTELNGVKGRKFTAKNGSGNFIFLPASGYRDGGSLSRVGLGGDYWSSSLDESNPASAYSLFFFSYSVLAGWGYFDRYYGLCVRPVAVKAQTTGLLLNAANFPDANFRAALASKLGIGEGDEITNEMIAATTWLNFLGKGIADLTGIEHFTALTSLTCRDNQLTSLDVSKNTALTSLFCDNNQLASLDVSKNTALTYLSCDGNQLTSLDVAGCTALTLLSCRDNQLTSLNVSGCTALKILYCNNNQLTSLDVSKNTVLTELRCDNNQLTSLDVSKNTALTELRCQNNRLTSLDVTGCAALTSLTCRDNQLTSLDVSKNIALTTLTCDNNQLTSLDVSKNTALTWLECNRNQLTSLDVSKNTALKYLYCSDNRLTSLDVSQSTALEWLFCEYNQLTSLDVSGCIALEEFWCQDNQLTSLDVSKNTKLTLLYCTVNQLTSLDVSTNTALTELWCGGNQLTTLDVSTNTALKDLYCGGNQLTTLDVSGSTALTLLWCDNNRLTSLDVLQNTALKTLWCYSNQIKGKEMDALVASLPTEESGEFIVIDTKDANEGNVCTKSQVAVAKGKGWTVYDYNGDYYNKQEYEGSEDPEQEIDPVDEGDNVDFCNDMDENSDLDGNVIGNIYYNVGNGNGEYDAENGCVVIKKTTDDGTVNDLEGKDIFGDDFKGTFTGIVFKVPAGKGTVKVTAETTGNMLLKVKIGSDEPVEMELEGKLKISFPYNVTSESLVYIYAGTSAEAKGLNATSSTDAALKIYGIEFLKDEATSIDRPTPDNSLNEGENWYTIDGVKLSGEPTMKGVYIVNGRKVVK